MELRPVSPAVPPAAPVQEVERRALEVEAHRARLTGQHAPPVGAPAGVGVQLERVSPGVQVARVVDRRTGEVICQTPPEQVLNVIASLMDSIRRREHAHAAEHQR